MNHYLCARRIFSVTLGLCFAATLAVPLSARADLVAGVGRPDAARVELGVGALVAAAPATSSTPERLGAGATARLSYRFSLGALTASAGLRGLYVAFAEGQGAQREELGHVGGDVRLGLPLRSAVPFVSAGAGLDIGRGCCASKDAARVAPAAALGAGFSLPIADDAVAFAVEYRSARDRDDAGFWLLSVSLVAGGTP